jgi:hypothetical protein
MSELLDTMPNNVLDPLQMEVANSQRLDVLSIFSRSADLAYSWRLHNSANGWKFYSFADGQRSGERR